MIASDIGLIHIFCIIIIIAIIITTNTIIMLKELVLNLVASCSPPPVIRLNEAIAKGGTLRRTGSLRHREAKVSSNFPRRFHFNLDFFAVFECLVPAVTILVPIF